MDDIDLREITREDYAAFLENVPHSAFHRLAWLDAVASTFVLRVRFLGYFRSGSLIAVTPLTGRRVGPFLIWGAPLRKTATPPATPFCSPAFDAAALLPHLHKWVKRQRISFTQVTLPGRADPDPGDADRTEPLDNLELALDQPLETIWKRLAQQKSAVRKAVRSGVRVHWRGDSSVLGQQRALVAATYGKQGIHPNIPARLYEELLQHRDQVGLRVMCATHAGKTIAATWALADSSKCYYWDAAALQESRDLNANHLLVWCLIRWAHNRNLTALDFVGTSTGGRGGSRPGIGRFKQSMGGRPVEYRLVYWYSPPARVAFGCYRASSALRAKLRSFIRKRHDHGN